ncbi:MAG TPA: adenylate/guanylate cyclase domain-containing protein [Gaiellales bacterium]|nr:adenylate/guanylate cyclase domain-containing protein [Gaiellales bacterium]
MATCVGCGRTAPPAARFCPTCGAPLSEAGGSRQERKTVTVLFADLVGFTARAEHMDIEDVRGLLAPYHALVRRELEQRGGLVEKFVGDAVMAVFGAPAAHEDDAERAVRAGLAIRDAAAAANEQRPDLDLHVRVGVNTGEALVLLDANVAAGEALASGDVVNTAARLQAAAPVDGVAVAEATHQRTRELIDYRALEPVPAKGKSAPVPCWEAVRARSWVGERAGDLIPLVDRLAQRHVLIESFERTRGERAVAAITLLGVPGIGKTRLVAELVAYIDPRPELIRWRQGRCLPYGASVTFAPLREIVKAEAGILESDDAATVRRRLGEAVAHVVADEEERAWIERNLLSMIGVGSTASLAGDDRAEAFAAWRRFFEHMAEHRASVFVFEDLHWADASLLEFIDHLVTWTEGLPLMVICTARPELVDRHPGWLRGTDRAHFEWMEPLSDEDTGRLFETLLGESAVPEEVLGRLLQTAGGNPLYAREFVRMLRDRGLLVRVDDGWRLASAENLPVPESVAGIVAARLDALSAEDKAIVQDAAVVGRAVWAGAVARVAGRGVWAVEEALRRLQERQLLRVRLESSVEGEKEYVFQHAVVREVAYSGIVRTARAQKHRRTAEWLESLTGDARGRIDRIANHYLAAIEYSELSGDDMPGLREAAFGAVRQAADRARALHAHAESAELYRHALELCSDAAAMPRLQLQYGCALARADQPAQEVLDEAARALVAAGDEAGAGEAESMAGWLVSLAGAPELARERDRRALAHYQGTGPSHQHALALTRAGAHWLFVPEARERARQLLAEGLAMARAVGRRELEAEALQFVGLARVDAGDVGGVGDLEQAVIISRELGSPVVLSCYGNLADIYWDLGELRQAAALRAEALEAALRFGLPIQVRRFRGAQTGDLYYAGEWDRALAHANRYLSAIEAGSPHRAEAEVRVLRGRVLLARGDVSGALHDAAAALDFARRKADPFDLHPALAFHAHASLDAAPAEAEACAAELLNRLRAGQAFWGAWALSDLLPVLRARGGLDRLAATVADVRPASAWKTAVVALAEGDPGRAADVYAAAGSLPDEALCRLWAAEQAGAVSVGGEARRQLAKAAAFYRRAGAAALLDAAERASA